MHITKKVVRQRVLPHCILDCYFVTYSLNQKPLIMKTVICNNGRFFPVLLSLLFTVTIVLNSSDSYSQENELLDNLNTFKASSSKITYSNPRVYNVDYSFEMVPDPAKIDRAKDLKLWIPIPRDWDSQKAVKIISIQPPPHATYEDPEHGNRMLFWDFSKEPEMASYKIDIKFRLESYEIHSEVDPEHIGPYDKTSKEYELYTQSGHTVHITPKVKELAKTAVGNETNPYLQARKILTFVHKKIQYYQGMNRSLDYMFSNSNIDERSGEEYFIGDCTHYSALFVALCRSAGIPARCVYGRIGWSPFLDEGNSKMYSKLDTVLTDDGFAGAQHHGLGPHMWAEFYLPDYGWIPVDPNAGRFGQLNNYKVIMSKGRDIDLGLDAPHKQHNGYGYQWVPIYDGRAEGLLSAVYNIKKITNARSNVYHTSPFPIVKYFVYFLTVIILSIIAGGFAGFICFHKFKKYAFVGLANIVPFVSLALPVISVKKEEQKRCSKVRFVSSFWIFSIFLLWLYVFPVMVKTDLVSLGTWNIFGTTVVCILSVLVSWILVDFLFKKPWIKNKSIRIIIKTILFIIFWVVSAYILGVWIVFPFA